MKPDADPDLTLGGDCPIPVVKHVLNLDGTTGSVQRTAELYEKRVAGCLNLASVVPGKYGAQDLPVLVE